MVSRRGQKTAFHEPAPPHPPPPPQALRNVEAESAVKRFAALDGANGVGELRVGQLLNAPVPQSQIAGVRSVAKIPVPPGLPSAGGAADAITGRVVVQAAEYK